MKFSITGHLGSGKTTICKLLNKDYNFEVVSAGSIMRSIGASKGSNILEFNKSLGNDESIDNYIDQTIIEKDKQIKDFQNVIFDSRLAWHFLKDSFKIFIVVSPYEAAIRAYLTRNDKDEMYQSVEEAMNKLIERRGVENKRYKSIYGVNCENLSNYDVVIDTTFISPGEAVEIIMECYMKKERNEPYHKLWISPQFLLPTGRLSHINREKIRQYTEMINNDIPIEPIKLLRIHDSLFVIEGHSRLIAYNLCKIKLINPIIVYDENDILEDGSKAKGIVDVSINDIKRWEQVNGCKYNYLPKIIRRKKKE